MIHVGWLAVIHVASLTVKSKVSLQLFEMGPEEYPVYRRQELWILHSVEKKKRKKKGSY